MSKGTHPRTDTYKTLRGKLNGLIQSASKEMGEAQLALIEKGYEYLRSICEVVVEKDLLQGVTQRYQPNVMMTKLPEIKFERLRETSEAIFGIFEKCCRCIASHSQPLETLNVRPNLSDLQADWKVVEDAAPDSRCVLFPAFCTGLGVGFISAVSATRPNTPKAARTCDSW